MKRFLLDFIGFICFFEYIFLIEFNNNKIDYFFSIFVRVMMNNIFVILMICFFFDIIFEFLEYFDFLSFVCFVFYFVLFLFVVFGNGIVVLIILKIFLFYKFFFVLLSCVVMVDLFIGFFV